MITVPIEKILFIDIETVGADADYASLQKNNPKLSSLFQHYETWFKKRFPEDEKLSLSALFLSRSALVPEFSKIVSVCLGIVDQSGAFKTTIFSDDNEKKLLESLRATLVKCGGLNYFLCGHNVKNFDIPMIAKRMMINGLKPPKILPSYDTKPWEVKAIDTRELWQYGQYASISTLDLMCSVMGVESSKSEDMDGSKVHNAYWKENKLSKINEYCEKDVKVLYDLIYKLINLN